MFSILWVVTLAAVLFAGRALLAAVTLHWSADRALRARKLDLEERALAVQENKTRSPAAPTTIPPDLYRRITRWGDPIAQEAERKNILDLYETFRDQDDPWVEVRSHLPAEPRDELSEPFAGMLS